jgi:hypothetical protein
MSRQPRGGGTGEVARGAGYAALLGALLIGVAVVIGIVLLQIGDRNDNGPASAIKPNTTTSTTKPQTTTPTATAKTGPTTPAKPAIVPGLLKLIVLNGGAKTGQATVMTNELKQQGYTSVVPANDWTGHTQVGNSVYCRGGLDREGARLAILVGQNVPFHPAFPKPAPALASGKDCFVVVGSKT